MFGAEFSKLNEFDDIDFGAEESKGPSSPTKTVVSDFDKVQRHRIAKTFIMHNLGPRFKKV